MLKVYYENSEQHPLVPFVWKLEGLTSFPQYMKDVADKIMEADFFDKVDDIDQADCIVIPYDARYIKDSHKYKAHIENLAKSHDKPVIYFSCGDVLMHLKLQCKTLRYVNHESGYDFKEPTVVLPPFVNFKDYGVKKNTYTRSVGFCGWSKVKINPQNICRKVIFQLLLAIKSNLIYRQKGILFRERMVKILEPLNTNFIIRDRYLGGGKTADNVKQEYVENILNSNFCLAVRGDGNYSVRFFEIMSLGRVPLLINTNSSLPLGKELDYSKFCVIIDFLDVGSDSSKIKEKLDEIDAAQYDRMCDLAYNTFKNKLHVKAFKDTYFTAEKLNACNFSR